jgi:outer membrane protein assembly factor BamB
VKKLLSVLLVALLTVAAAVPQTAPRFYTTPTLPDRAALARLDLTLAWSLRLPVEGSEDGLADIKLLPAGKRLELLVQTRLGMVLMLDPETGDILWQRQLGRPFEHVESPAYTDDNLYLTRRETLFVLNRKTGRQRLYEVDPSDGHVTYGFNLKTVPSATPAADQDRIYFPMGDRLAAYDMPRFAVLEAAKEKETPEKAPARPEPSPSPYSPPAPRPTVRVPAKNELTPRISSAQPEWAWGSYTEGYPIGVPVIFPPILVKDTVNVLGTNGTLISINPDRLRGKVEERYRYRLFGAVAVPMVAYQGILYMGCEDHRVYALEAESRRLLWRFRADAVILRRPIVTDRDVFISATKIGLYRVDRESGEEVWLNKRAVRFLATNEKFVYVLDGAGKLLVLDYARGSTLSGYDLSKYTVPYSNDTTDRVFLGANDGTLLCLHHRSERFPYRTRGLPKPIGKEQVTEKKEEKAAPEKEKEEAPKKPAKKEEMKKAPPKAKAKEAKVGWEYPEQDISSGRLRSRLALNSGRLRSRLALNSERFRTRLGRIKEINREERKRFSARAAPVPARLGG